MAEIEASKAPSDVHVDQEKAFRRSPDHEIDVKKVPASLYGGEVVQEEEYILEDKYDPNVCVYLESDRAKLS